MNIIDIKNLSYEFTKGIKVLDDVNLGIPKGSVFGFLGPNGAGKTTTLRLILGLLNIQSGSVNVFGKEFSGNRNEILSRTGSLIESPSFYPHLTAYENMTVYRHLYGSSETDLMNALETVKLTGVKDKKVGTYSLGMKQRLAIAIAIQHRPELLILDEPGNGLDPQGIIEMRELIKSLSADSGSTILVSSHILSEVEKFATHTAIINKGKIIFQGSVSELDLLKSDDVTLIVRTEDNQKAVSLIEKLHKCKIEEGEIFIMCTDKTRSAEINKMLLNNGVVVSEIYYRKNTLENLFIELTS